MTDEIIWPAVLLLIAAMMYAAVGEAGASGYLAAMGLFGHTPTLMKPTAFALNLLVTGIGTFQFWRLGLFS
ncbi:hypothetical protein [Agrobacterium tumefaciens]|uniref:hypothetical protein n=1 Tax=Agrobacterium tumefaciens TaxID=358 RepID=UPI00287D9DE4|nr:hypothetical protein [Agrobacterium tumefaciens]MDS7598510.1 hypothetical protein [Agrobacterium tumefaciens]